MSEHVPYVEPWAVPDGRATYGNATRHGHQARCSCGWKGAKVRQRDAAERQAIVHGRNASQERSA